MELRSDIGQHRKRQGEVMGTYMSIAKMGTILSFAVSGVIVATFGIRELYPIMACWYLIGMAFCTAHFYWKTA